MQRSDGGQQPEGRAVTTTPSVAALSAIPTTHHAVTQLRVAGRVPVVTATAAIGKNGILICMKSEAVSVSVHLAISVQNLTLAL